MTSLKNNHITFIELASFPTDCLCLVMQVISRLFHQHLKGPRVHFPQLTLKNGSRKGSSLPPVCIFVRLGTVKKLLLFASLTVNLHWRCCRYRDNKHTTKNWKWRTVTAMWVSVIHLAKYRICHISGQHKECCEFSGKNDNKLKNRCPDGF